jgi:hypothetical protein
MFQYIGATVSGVIAAPTEAIWALVGDVTRHPEIAGSGEVRAVHVRGSGALAAGAVFESNQVMRGMSYVSANRVVLWDPPYRFAWRVGFPQLPGIGQIWMFDLTPEANGTRVENAVVLPYAIPTFFPFRLIHQFGSNGEIGVMLPTLQRLAELLEAPPPTAVVTQQRAPAILETMLAPAIVPGGLMLLGTLVGVGMLRRLWR